MLETKSLKPVHTRMFAIQTFTADDDSVIVEGELRDDRLESSYMLSGERREPGTIHHMLIRMHIGGPMLTIREIEAEMPGAPRRECLETRQSLERLVGLTLIGGFTLNVKERIGGPRGCTHLLSLVLAMASAAVQGFWANLARNPQSREIVPLIAERYLADTCYVWRKNGSALAELGADNCRSEEKIE